MIPQEQADLVQRIALDAGFDLVGIAPVGPVAGGAYLDFFLDHGRQGEMNYLARTRDLRIDSSRLLEGARSVIVVAHNYRPDEKEDSASEPQATTVAGPPSLKKEASPTPPRGRVARYAWGADYHEVLRDRLHKVVERLREAIAEPFDTRVCVDTAPILEREVAAAAGVGWIGKNTMVIHPRLGSYFFLGEIVTTLALPPSEPIADHCGSCTRCLRACPTQAFIGPYRMDPRRCISYLTIEHRGDIPPELEPQIGDWVFGCDVCQEVCPHNRAAPTTTEPAYRPDPANPLVPRPLLSELVALSPEDHSRYLAHSAMNRAKPQMLQRNARIALRNHAAQRAG